MEIALELYRVDRTRESAAACRQILEQEPGNAGAVQLLGLIARKSGNAVAAVRLLRQAIAMNPRDARARSNLASALGAAGRHEEAAREANEAVRLQPEYAEGHHNLAVALERLGRFDEAVKAYQTAIGLKPHYTEAHNHLGNALRALGRLEVAVASHRRAIELMPGYVEAHAGLAADFNDLGRADAAVESLRKVTELSPASAASHSNLLMTMHYDPRCSRKELFEEARRWGKRHAPPPVRAATPNDMDRTPGRRLRIGYISPDLRDHPIGRLIEPVLGGHDRQAFEVFCYSDAQQPDALTTRLKEKADVWRDIRGEPDAAVAEQIRSDGIDILVETAGHFGGNRLPMMAARSAPVQVSHFGYCDTTGVPGIDYRLTDAWSDPPGQTERYHTERLVRLPDCAWCYCPADPTPDVAPLPALKSGRVTFGNLNNLIKMSDAAVALWSRILHAAPGSRLMLLARQAAWAEVRERFAVHRIGPENLSLVAPQPRPQYLELFHQIDICSDPFPFNGDNSTFDAFWMGVPVVTLAGNAFVSRRGVSHLSNVGLSELIGNGPEEYEAIAVNLAADLPALAGIRAGLRERLRRSPLGHAKGYIAHLELC